MRLFMSDPGGTVEEHPWKWYLQPDTEVLIVGTFPSAKKNWSFDFFYPNKRNFFWKIIGRIVRRDFLHSSGNLAVVERMRALDDLKVGITDMGLLVMRKNSSSLDEKLTLIQYMDIHGILTAYEKIRIVLLTSSSGRISAKAWFQSYLSQRGTMLKFPNNKGGASFEFSPGRFIHVYVMPSPSPRYANKDRLQAIADVYEQHILRRNI